MKKVILLIALLFLLSGCTYEYKYEFTKNYINSSIKASFTEEEFMKNYNDLGNDKIKNIKEVKSIIDNIKTTTNIQAFTQDYNYFYEEVMFEKDYAYNVLYEYKYDYNNFKDNYIFNDCFDYFLTYEDNEAYYYNIAGNYKCTYNNDIVISVKSDYLILKNNSDEHDNNELKWNVKEEDNDIYFAISKNILNKSNKNTISILALIIIIVLTSISLILFYVLKHKENM